MDVAAVTADELEQRMDRLERIVAARLERFARPVNLMTYEGTLLDRLCYTLVRRVWSADRFEVICSVRPCMLPQLVKEVREFARIHGYPIVDFQGDCSARYPWLAGEPRSCENISTAIDRRLRSSNGLLLSAALLNADNLADFVETNHSYSDLYVFDTPELARHRDPSNGRDWAMLFALQGFSGHDLIAAYLHFVSQDLAQRHFPTCYLDCYNEQAQRRMSTLIETVIPHVLGLLQRRPPRAARPRNNSGAWLREVG
jgi:hypothetical protein